MRCSKVCSNRRNRTARSFRLALSIFATLSGPAFAADSLSIPDFSSNDVGWIGIGNELEQPQSGPGPVTFDPEHPYISNARAQQTGEAANFRVADVSNPILQPWAVDLLRAQNQEALSGVPVFDGKVRCWPSGVPAFLLRPGSPIKFLQTPDDVVVLLEPDHQVRRVAMNRAHSENLEPSWNGESVGHYQGDTLVVDTIGFSDRTVVDNYRTPHTTMLHVVEHYRMIEGGSLLEVIIWVEDQGAFTVPWTAVRRFRRDDSGSFLERVCAENNERYFGFEVQPIPQDHTLDF